MENLRSSQGYIFRILQHFGTNGIFWNFTTFESSFWEFFCLGLTKSKIVYYANCQLA